MPRYDDRKNGRTGNEIEREAGASPPVFMPAIMGWISQEEQRQRATDLVEFSNEIAPTGKAKNNKR